MGPDLLLVLAVAGSAAAASLAGGAVSLWMRMTSFRLSLAVGFAGGVLFGAFAFEMLPKAAEQAGPLAAAAAFAVGFALIYALDLYVNRGALAGEKADERARVDWIHRRHPPRGSEVSVLAGGTSAEELVEGLSIGVGLALDPQLGLTVGLAVAIDNFAESLSIGELCRAEHGGKPTRRVYGWTGLIAASVLLSALAGWFLLRELTQWALGVLIAVGAGGMFYLAVTDLVPQAESHQFQQSAALAAGAGFLVLFLVSAAG